MTITLNFNTFEVFDEIGNKVGVFVFKNGVISISWYEWDIKTDEVEIK